MEWFGKTWCITVDELTRDDRTEANQSSYLEPVLSLDGYKNYKRSNKLKVVRRGGGANCPALVDYESLPEGIKERVRMKYPDMSEMQSKRDAAFVRLVESLYERDLKAQAFYLVELTERNLSLTKGRLEELANEYTTNASVIQAVKRLKEDSTMYRRVRQGKRVSWADMSEVIAYYREAYGHTLGLSPTRFASWVRAYEAEGYTALISKKFGNNNRLKVSMKVEKLLLEIASDPHRPYKKTTWEWYCDFLAGEETIINRQTGEIYDPAEYPDLSEKTVGDILKKPLNEARLSVVHDEYHDYKTQLRPHRRRTKPRYSLSMLSLDDKDFGLKVKWTTYKSKMVRGRLTQVPQSIVTRLKAYICYDVASSAIVGYAFSGDKDKDLFERCMRNVYDNLLHWGLGQPHEAQVENHLVSSYKEGMMKSGVLFPIVRFAEAQNSQEKYAEHFNRTLKYSFEKYAVREPIGRPEARLRENRTKNRKVSDEANNNYKQGLYDFEEACRVYVYIMDAYNQELHPDQKRYEGMTRLEVLQKCVHPDIQPINKHQLTHYLGYKTLTSVVRGAVQVAGEHYMLSPEMLERLRGRSGKVEAYRWEEEAEEVYLYQEDVYLGICPRIEPYQVAQLERSEGDKALLIEQAKRIAQWDRAVKEGMPEGIERISTDSLRDIELKPLKTVAMPLEGDWALSEEAVERVKGQDYASRAFSDL